MEKQIPQLIYNFYLYTIEIPSKEKKKTYNNHAFRLNNFLLPKQNECIHTILCKENTEIE